MMSRYRLTAVFSQPSTLKPGSNGSARETIGSFQWRIVRAGVLSMTAARLDGTFLAQAADSSDHPAHTRGWRAHGAWRRRGCAAVVRPAGIGVGRGWSRSRYRRCMGPLTLPTKRAFRSPRSRATSVGPGVEGNTG
jgi:hypothetical protein